MSTPLLLFTPLRFRWATLWGVVLLWIAAPGLSAQETAPDVLLERARYAATIRGDLETAIEIYRDLVEHHGDRRETVAQALLELGRAHETLGREGAREAYTRIVSDYADQVEAAAAARRRLADLSPAPPPSGTGVAARQIWSSGEEFGPGSVSPDGRELAFIDWGFLDDEALRGRAETAVLNLRTGRARPVGAIPPLDTYASTPLWRDDGSRLVYSMWDTTWTHMKLHIVAPDGSGDRVLVGENRHQRILALDWRSSTGEIAARIQDWDDVNRIGLISERDGSIRMLRSLGTHALASLTQSPDGSLVVYAYPSDDEGPAHDLRVLRADGSGEVPLAPHPADDRFPLWTPDGRRVVFLSDRSGRPGLWSVEVVDGRQAGEPRLVLPEVGDIRPIDVTDAGAVAYSRHVLRSYVELATLDLDRGGFTAEPRNATERYIGTNAMPSWSPDGTHLAFQSVRGTGLEQAAHLVVREMDTGEERTVELPFDPYARFATPRWSADGQTILMEGGAYWGRVSYRIDLQTGRVEEEPWLRSASGFAANKRKTATERQVEALRTLGLRLAGQNDGRLYIEGDAAFPPDETVLLVRNGVSRLARGVEEREWWEPTTADHHMHAWSLSPDGRTLAMALASEPGPEGMSDRLILLSLENREAREIARPDVPEGMEINTVQWLPDGRHVLFTVSDNHEEAFPVWMVPAEGGEPRRLELELTQMELLSLAFHPDGRTVAFTRQDQWHEVWLLEGLPWQSPER